MSLTEHPDKRQPDQAKNESTQSINDHWVEITKAFKTLTDDEIRNNYIQYGHPDGKQSFSIGIALPQFIITEGNGKYVLLLYASLLGVLLPFLLGRWWYGTQSMTRDGILVESAGRLFTEYKEDMDEGGVVGALSRGAEYDSRLQATKEVDSLGKVERRLLDATDKSKTKFAKPDRTKLLSLSDEPRRKILGLLWAYLYRTELDDATLNERKHAEVPRVDAKREDTDHYQQKSTKSHPSPSLSTRHSSRCVSPTATPHHSSPASTPPNA